MRWIVIQKRLQKPSPRNMGGDMWASKQKAGSRYGLALRLSKDVVDRLRWRDGDRISLAFGLDGDTGVFRLTRVDDDTGYQLRVKKTGIAAMKATVSDATLEAIFPDCKSGYQGTLDTAKADEAMFLVDYA